MKTSKTNIHSMCICYTTLPFFYGIELVHPCAQYCVLRRMIGGIGAGRVSRSAVLPYRNDPVTSHITFLDSPSNKGPYSGAQYSPGKDKKKLPRTPWKTAGIVKERVNHGSSWRHGHPDSRVKKKDNGP